MRDRYYWADVLSELRQVLIRVEQTTKNKLRTDAGVWIEQLLTTAPGPREKRCQASSPARNPGRRMRGRSRKCSTTLWFGRASMAPSVTPAATEPIPAPAARADGAAPGPASGRRKSPGDTNEIATLTITFRAVSLKNVSGQADADKGIAYTVLQELQSSPLFDSDPKKREPKATFPTMSRPAPSPSAWLPD